ncbi:MAG: DNA primase catalytic subunit PriS [Thermoplasmata archaeon]|nr:MAG: DNA primase catalytic subunit PriS [Thermoplasmata archaeon]
MQKTISFLKQEFSNYYAQTDLDVPQRFGRREWGFFYFQGKGMQRHLAFNRVEELRDFLITRSPRHVYYSSAYYQNPEVQPMPRKVEGWLGADLIFDLDDEHLSGTEGLTIAQRLEKVKRIVKDRLLDDFLLSDFGINPESLKVTFSGGRGYHIHVFDPRVLTLESPERREIVDYITGLGLDFNKIFKEQAIKVDTFRTRKVTLKSKTNLPDESESGWSGKMTEGIMRLLDDMENLSKNECIELIQGVKINEKPVSASQAKTTYKRLFDGKPGERGIDIIREDKVIEILSPDSVVKIFLELAKNKVKGIIAGETDEPVTVDTRRLIRFPGSLHGKTGLRVVTIPLGDLDEFDPLKDSIAFDDQPVEVKIEQDSLEFELGGEQIELRAGIQSLPKYSAIYLMCRGLATIA